MIFLCTHMDFQSKILGIYAMNSTKKNKENKLCSYCFICIESGVVIGTRKCFEVTN